MRQVCILVERQTEEAVVKTLLIDAAQARGIYLTPIIVRTSLTPAGASRGGGSWKHYDRQLNALLSQSHWDVIGLMVDYYGYPSGAPGFELPEAPGDQRQLQIVAALKEHYPDPLFHPLVVLHEIESLILAAIRAGGGRGLLSEKTIEHLIRAIDDAGGPEKINNGEKTSPSKRLLALEHEYGKTSTGISILREVGLAVVLDRCPVFAAWWRTLLSC